jgi:Lon protease-like protein
LQRRLIEVAMWSGGLPLFPLRTVLFPGARLDLRVFEMRYLDMVRCCMRADTCFGVVAIRRGSEVGEAQTYTVGTTARIVDWSATAGGLLHLSVCGVERFRCDSIRREPSGLYLGLGAVALSDDAGPLGPSDAWAKDLLASLLQRNRGDPGGAALGGDALAERNRVCWNLARLLPLTLAARQELLEIEGPDARLDWLRARAGLPADAE